MMEMVNKLINEQKLIRRVAFVWMLALTTHIVLWSIDFVTNTTKTGAEVGLMVAAITGPWSLLQGYVFKMYNESRKEDAAGG